MLLEQSRSLKQALKNYKSWKPHLRDLSKSTLMEISSATLRELAWLSETGVFTSWLRIYHLYSLSVPTAELQGAWTGLLYATRVFQVEYIFFERNSATVITRIQEDLRSPFTFSYAGHCSFPSGLFQYYYSACIPGSKLSDGLGCFLYCPPYE